MGPGTLVALQAMLARLATIPGALIASATDANEAGDRYAERHAELAAEAGVRFERLRPPEGIDFNDVLKQGRAHEARSRLCSAAVLRPN
jgi:predicted nuclease with TOPRIM domain